MKCTTLGGMFHTLGRIGPAVRLSAGLLLLAGMLPGCMGLPGSCGLDPPEAGQLGLPAPATADLDALLAGAPVRMQVFDPAADDGYNGHHAPFAAVLPDGRLAAAWFSYEGPGELDGSQIRYAVLDGASATWGSPRLLVGGSGSGNPVLLPEADGRLTLLYTQTPGFWALGQPRQREITPDGLPLGPSSPIVGEPGLNIRSRPLRLADGGLLLGAYSEISYSPVFLQRSPSGRWSTAARLDVFGAQAIQPVVLARRDGSLFGAFRPTGEDRRIQFRNGSADGQCWSSAASGLFPNPLSSVDAMVLAGGAWLLAFNDVDSGRTRLAVSLSDDEGRTWSVPEVLVDERNAAYPSLAQTPDGVIHMLWSEDRQAIGHLRFTEPWLRWVSQP